MTAPSERLDVGDAIRAAKAGKYVRRRSWTEGFSVTIDRGDFRDHDGDYYSIYPLDAEDLLATDWVVLADVPKTVR